MYLWKIEYNLQTQTISNQLLWIALNYVSLKDWIQSSYDDIVTMMGCELL